MSTRHYMSTHEYNDLFLKCQTSGKFHMFTFDIKDSRLMSKKSRSLAQIKLYKLVTLMYNTIYKKQLNENKEILVFNKDYTHLGEELPKQFGLKQEPFLIGDLIGFTVYRDSISNDDVFNIFNECKKIVDIDFEFHIADGYYETDVWTEAQDKYFRGYCIDLLSNLHKSYNNNIRQELKKIRK